MNVPLLDLKQQYQSLKDDIMQSLDTVITEQQFILGPNVAKIEQEIAAFCGAPYAVGVNSGSDALLLAMMCIDIQPGEKVITTPYTFFATAGSICRLNAVPVFVDIDPDTYNIDPDKVSDALNAMSESEKASTKAIMPVHLYGQCADMKPIIQTAEENNLVIIEDAAQALGASYELDGKEKMACALGDFGCISFFPSKNLGGFGDGGMITTNDERASEKLYSLRMHGQAAQRYHHTYVGMNGRLDALQAAVLLIKLPHLDSWAQKRRDNAAYYMQLFEEAGLSEFITPPHISGRGKHVFNQFVIRAGRRDDLQQHLAQNNIGCAIYYPLPLHMQDCFAFLGYKKGDFPVAEKAATETLALPVFPELTKQQIEYVVEKIAEFYKK